MEQEVNCWQCGNLLRPKPLPEPEPAPPDPAPEPATEPRVAAKPRVLAGLFSRKPQQPPAPPPRPEDLIRFEGEFNSTPGVETPSTTEVSEDEPAQPNTSTRMTLTGEVVEVEETAPDDRTQPVPVPTPDPDRTQQVAATIGATQLAAEPGPELMILTFCKHCGLQNQEGIRECARCKNMLEIVEVGSVKDVEPLPRSWGFDVLGAVWIILGLAAVYCGQFIVKANNQSHSVTWSDYFWTGVVVCAPGIFIFMRHYFCKTLFWVMTLASMLVWAVIFVIWITGHLFVTENAQVGLSWLLALSLLSAFSFFTVRVNDEFDFGS
jgi:hypothetical protein